MLYNLSVLYLEIKKESKSRILEQKNFVEVSGHNLKSSQTLDSVNKVYITNQFKTTFAQARRVGVNPLVEVTVNRKEENS